MECLVRDQAPAACSVAILVRSEAFMLDCYGIIGEAQKLGAGAVSFVFILQAGSNSILFDCSSIGQRTRCSALSCKETNILSKWAALSP